MEQLIGPDAIKRLLRVQECDRKIRQCTQELSDLPARAAQISARLADCLAQIEQAKERVKVAQTASHKIELEIESHKQRIAKFREQQFQIKTNTEYRALEAEIAAEQAAIAALEDKELAEMEAAEALRAEIVAAEDMHNREKLSVDAEMAKLDARKKEIEATLAAAKAERDKLAADVEPSWLAYYDRILSHVGDDALVPIAAGTCGGCHLKVPAQLVHDTRRSTGIVTCNYCGRMLYYAESK